MTYTSDVIASCLNALNSDKQTERKQACAKFSNLIKNGDVLQLLDDNSKEKESRDLSWDIVLRTVLGYVDLELDVIRNSKVLPETKMKRKREAGAILLCVVQTAEKRGPHLRIVELCKHVVKHLRDDELSPALYHDYTAMLCKGVFLQVIHMSELTPALWNDLLELYIKMVQSDNKWCDRLLAMQTLHLLISHASRLHHFKPRPLFAFFGNLPLEIRNESSSPVLEVHLRCLNKFCMAAALDCRHQMCSLGEKLIPAMIPIWNKCWQPAKEQMVTFFLLQMKLHHPCGVHITQEDAWACDESSWTNCIRAMYQLVVDDFSRLGKKIQRAKTSSLLKWDIVALATDVIHQIIRVESGPISESSTDTDASKKKAKLESFWMKFEDHLVATADPVMVIAWLQVLGSAIEQYPCDFSKDEFASMLQTLSTLQSSLKKRTDVLSVVFSTLSSMATASPPYQHDATVIATWASIVSNSVKYCVVPQCQDNVYKMLQAIIEGDVAKDVFDFVKVLLADHSTPSTNTIHLLWSTLCHIPLRLSRSLGSCSALTTSEQIINWLIPCPESLAENSARIEKEISHFVIPEVAMAIVSLIHKNTFEVAKCFPAPLPSSRNSNKVQLMLDAIEGVSSDHCSVSPEVSSAKSASGRSSNPVLIKEMAVFLLDRLQSLIDFMFNDGGIVDDFSDSASCRLALHFVCLLSNLMLSLSTANAKLLHRRADIYTQVSLLCDRMGTVFSSSLQQVGLSNGHCTPDNAKHLEFILKCLQQGFLDGDTRTLFPTECHVCVIPKPCVGLLLSILNARSQTSEHVGHSDFEHNGNNLDSMEVDDDIPASSNCAAVPSLPSLSSSICLLVNIADMSVTCQDECHSRKESIRKSVIDIVGKLSPESLSEVELCNKTIGWLCRGESPVNLVELETMLEALRKSFSENRNNQDVCIQGLSALCGIIPHTQRVNRQWEGWKQCKDIINTLLSAFWALRSNKYCPEVRVHLLACIQALGKLRCESWLQVQSLKNLEEGFLIPNMLAKLLCDRNHQVRMLTANAVKCYFRDLHGNAKLEVCFYKMVCAALSKVVVIEDDLTDDEVEEESSSRAKCLLLTLSNVIRASEICEKSAVSRLINDCAKHFVDVKILSKIFEQLANEMGYACSKAFFKERCFSMIWKWVCHGRALEEFPAEILGMDNPAFLSTFSTHAIACLVLKNKEEELETFNNAVMHKSHWSDLIRDNFHSIMSCSLSWLAMQLLTEDRNESRRKLLALGLESYKFVSSVVDEDMMATMMKDYLPDIIIGVLLRKSPIDLLLDEDLRPDFDIIFQYVANCFNSDSNGLQPSLLSRMASSKDSFQKILLALCEAVTGAKRPMERKNHLTSYQYFVQLLMENVSTLHDSNWEYITHDVIHRCCHFIADDFSVEMTDIILETLETVVTSSMMHCCEELMKNVFVIVSSVMPLLKLNGPHCDKAMVLLQIMLTNNWETLSPAISSLDAFPEEERFSDFNHRIVQCKENQGTNDALSELERFLNNSTMSPCFTMERLKDLEKILKKFRPILLDYVSESKDWQERVSKLVLLLCRESASEDVAMRLLCAKCLGIIGPINLHLLSLPAAENRVIQEARSICGDCTEEEQQYASVAMLADFLTDKRLDVVAMAVTTLRNILRTPGGIAFARSLNAIESQSFSSYIEPFKQQKKKKASMSAPKTPAPSAQRFESRVSSPKLWSCESINVEEWVSQLSSSLIDSGAVEDTFLSLLGPMCSLQSSFAEAVLPYIFHDVLKSGKESYRQCLSSNIMSFTKQFINSESGPDDDGYSQCTQIARLLLTVINFLRMCQKPKKGKYSAATTAWDNNFWLDVDYLDLAKMAWKCSSHFAVLLYSEIWHDVNRLPLSMSNRGTSSLADSSQEKLLLDAYRHIDEPDGIYGIGAGCSTDHFTRIQRYEHEHKYGKALFLQNLTNTRSVEAHIGLAKNLSHFGLHHVTASYLKGVASNGQSTSSQEFLELQYEAAWRNCEWQMDEQEDANCFSYDIFKSFVSLREGDAASFEEHIKRARLNALGEWSMAGARDMSHVYKTLASLFAVDQLQRFNATSHGGNNKSEADLTDAKSFTGMEFDYIEPALSMHSMAHRISIAGMDPASSASDDDVQMRLRAAVDHFQQFSSLAKDAAVYKICEREISCVRDIAPMLTSTATWKIDEAEMYWCQGETTHALHLLEQVMKQANQLAVDEELASHARVVSLYGNWLAESKSENPYTIINEYLDPGVKMMKDCGHAKSEDVLEAYHSLAKYSDCQYQAIVDYMTSTLFENKQELSRSVKEQFKSLQKVGSGAEHDVHKFHRHLEVSIQEDERELQKITNDRMLYLLKAIKSYFKCLKFGEKYDMVIFRLCSLWFANCQVDAINKAIEIGWRKIASSKFVPLLYQLAARIGTASTLHNRFFKDTLEAVIVKATIDHPHHGVPILVALCNADAEKRISVGGKAKQSKSKTDKSFTEDGRVQAAKDVLGCVRNCQPKVVQEMDILAQAYIELAYENVNHLKAFRGPHEMSSALLIRKATGLKAVAVPTMDIPVDPTCKYTNIVTVARFDSKFGLCGGVNLPKIVTCLGSDGVRRRQLVKGRDDLRQDAVMQQIFSIVSKLLKKDPESKKRSLHIRTYKVVPLSQRCGLVEWCEGTMPLGEYLVGSGSSKAGAHARYNPSDLPASECRKILSNATGVDGKPTKLDAYKDIMARFHPVMRHFFLENFPDPATWFMRRLAYTRSCAASSIVGYVVGLGDRHVQNILIDCNSAELVHIDLGVAFEQGKLLPTPETVPFRLSRDVVDGMGLTGVEGVFRRCCEKTMKVMRSSHGTILTIVEVLLYDPLYVWTLSPSKAMGMQRRSPEVDVSELSRKNSTCTLPLTDISTTSASPGPDQSKNKMAERVLVRLKQKLDGCDGGSFISIEGQINSLIQNARDERNLCRIFAGWQPWL